MSLHTLVRWLTTLGRALAGALVLFWGVFFIEHLDWFSGQPLPPLRIWLAQVAHLTLLAGLVLSAVRYFMVGSIVTIASLVAFFVAAGWPGVPWLFWITVTPAALFVAAHFAGSGRRAALR